MYLQGIETARLSFRKLKWSDTGTWEGFFEDNPNLEYLGLDLSLGKKAQSNDWIARQLARYKENRFGHHALIEKETGNFIGQSGLLKQEIDGKTEVEIGYHILPEYWGNGYATEAARQVMHYAKDQELCESLISVIDVRNIGSQKVAQKIGMKIDVRMRLYGLTVFIYRIDITGE